MKIAIIGYGKMGKEIEKIAVARGHEIVVKFSSTAPIQKETLAQVDVAIEFTQPHIAIDNIQSCFDAHVPVVVGTTGWYGRFGEVKSALEQQNQSLFYATNFSVGVNLLFALNTKLAQLMNGFDSYSPHIHEVHHTEKLDAPSGTAISLAEQILDNLDRKTDWTDEPEKDTDLLVTAARKPDVPGTHTVIYENEIDQLSIHHVAKNRRGFALGAVLAAEYLLNKKGLHTMKDMLSLKSGW